MATTYRLFGSMGSPYSVKVRSFLRYKDVDHVWLVRNTPETMAEHKKFSKLPLVPTIVSPEGEAMQDSTPIMEAIEAKFPEPAAHPADPTLRFLSELLEEFGDEWGNKWMMHYRWYSSRAAGTDAPLYCRRIAAEIKSGSPVGTPNLDAELEGIAGMFKDRMLGRAFTVGSNETTTPIIEGSYLETIALLDAHLSAPGRPYLFGKTPCFADFGLTGQLAQCLSDVTAGELMRVHAPHVALWCERMLNPQVVRGGGFESWEALAPTLQPLLASQAAMFLLWSAANERALEGGAKEMTVDLGSGRLWTQSVGGPQKYHAKSLKELRKKYAKVSGDAKLADILKVCGCLDVLSGSASSKL